MSDGPNKPSHKRNQSVAGKFGTSDARSRQFKALLDECGLEWWNAPGEAEAELAIMNRQGKIDAILSDDVDALLFGATCLLRNNSPTLSGAQASTQVNNSAKSDTRQYEIYRSSAILDILAAKEGSRLRSEEDCRMAMVLIALLGGGDYAPEGISNFGATISHGLASAGCAEYLKLYLSDPLEFEKQLPELHSKMISELRTNTSKQGARKYPDRAAKLATRDPQSLFPAFALDAYLRPATSDLERPDQGWPGFGKGQDVYQKRGRARNEGRGDLEGFAKACETFFEWGTTELVSKKFASESVGLFGAEVMIGARDRVRQARGGGAAPAAKTFGNGPSQSVGLGVAGPSRISAFFQSTTSSSQASKRPANVDDSLKALKIVSTRPDPTNPDILEYRITYSATPYIQRCLAAMDGTRIDPKYLSTSEKANLGLVDKDADDDLVPTATQAAAPKSELRVWVAEYLVKEAWPEMIKEYEEDLAAKAAKKAGAQGKVGNGRAKAVPRVKAVVRGVDTRKFVNFFTQTQREITPEEEEEQIESRSPSRTERIRSLSVDIDTILLSSPSRSHRSSSPLNPLNAKSGKKNARALPPSSSSQSSCPSPTSFENRPDVLLPPRTSRTPSLASRSSPLSELPPSSPPVDVRTTRHHRAKVIRIAPSSPLSSPPPVILRATRTTRATRSKVVVVSSQSSEISRSAQPVNDDGVIDLCSSEDDADTPKRPQRARPPRKSSETRDKTCTPSVGMSSRPGLGVLGNSTKENTPSPRPTTPGSGVGMGRRIRRGSGTSSKSGLTGRAITPEKSGNSGSGGLSRHTPAEKSTAKGNEKEKDKSASKSKTKASRSTAGPVLTQTRLGMPSVAGPTSSQQKAPSKPSGSAIGLAPLPKSPRRARPIVIEVDSDSDANEVDARVIPALSPIGLPLRPAKGRSPVAKSTSTRPNEVGPTIKGSGRMEAMAPLYVVTYEDDRVVKMDVRARWRVGERIDAV